MDVASAPSVRKPQMMKAVYDMARKGARDEIQAQMRDGGLFSGGGR
ncbi:phage tail tape measure protein [Escherichia coli]|nr:phage tail tape measure protein [Escherichia coli]